MSEQLIRIEQGTWYYFTVDLDFKGYAAFTFERYITLKDRVAALVHFNQPKYFSTQDLLLVPYLPGVDYFTSKEEDILSVWTVDGTKLHGLDQVDLSPDWPGNVLDKAAITPSKETAAKWTK